MPHVPTLDDLQRLMSDVIIPFYYVERATPLVKPNRQENDAEHSWSLSLMACALAAEIDKTLDLGKIAQFVAVHDLVEVHAGDTSNLAHDDVKATKEAREEAAFKQLQRELTAFPWICQTIEAYERQDSNEAKFVKSVDKLLPLLFDYIDSGEVYKRLELTQDEWEHKLTKHREKARAHDGVYVYYERLRALLAARPDFFHQDSRIGEANKIDGALDSRSN